MRDEPTARDLLETARTVFREELLPALPREARYTALMVLNAMGIAARQAAAGDRPLDEARMRLEALCQVAGADLGDLERRFVADIRAGRYDPGTPLRDQAFLHLLKTTRAKAAESAPKALETRGE